MGRHPAVESISDSSDRLVPSLTSSNRRLRNLLTAVLAVLAATLVQVSSAFAGVLQESGGERPWNQEWASWSCADLSRVQEVTSPAVQGRKAYELTVRDGDNSWGERCELGQGNPGRSGFPLFRDGDDRWMSFQVYLPDNYPLNTPYWNVFFQIHQEGDGGCPPISLNVEDGQFKLFNSSRRTYVTNTVEKWHAPAQRNRWTKFTVHVKNSTEDDVGFVEVYSDLDGQGMKLVMPKTYMHTMTARSDNSAMINHARIGIYRNPAIQGTSSIYFDGFTIATDRAGAEDAAFGAPSVQDPPPNPLPTPVPNPLPTPAPLPTPTTQGNGGGTARPAPQTRRSRRSRRHRARRVVLRSRRHVGLARAAGWPRILPVYGWVKRSRHIGRRSVVIEIRRNGRWVWLTRGWLRSNGRFYLAPSLDVGGSRKVVLRAHVRGVGYSNPLRARI
jgi:polysaccharide lyase-like protein